MSTLRSPSTLLGGREDLQLRAPDQNQVIVCALKSGSKIRKGADAASPLILTVADESGNNGDSEKCRNFEALDEVNSWTCVVAPGYRLGWVEASSDVLKTEVALAEISDNVPPLYDVTVNTAVNDEAPAPLPAQPLKLWLKSIGPQLSELDLSGTDFYSTDTEARVFKAIAVHCGNLRERILE